MLFIWLTCLITVSPTIRHKCKKTKSWLRFALSYKEGKTREQEQIILLFKKKEVRNDVWSGFSREDYLCATHSFTFLSLSLPLSMLSADDKLLFNQPDYATIFNDDVPVGGRHHGYNH